MGGCLICPSKQVEMQPAGLQSGDEKQNHVAFRGQGKCLGTAAGQFVSCQQARGAECRPTLAQVDETHWPPD